MNNHIHLIWQSLQNSTPSQNQGSFMKFTARQLLLSLFKDDKDLHASLKVNKYDRDYQVWKREPLSIELPNKTMFIQSWNTYIIIRYVQVCVSCRKIIIIHRQSFIMTAVIVLVC